MARAGAQYIKTTRRQLGLTQIELAALLGLGRHAIIRYERGEELPKSIRLALKYLITQHNKNGKGR